MTISLVIFYTRSFKFLTPSIQVINCSIINKYRIKLESTQKTIETFKNKQQIKRIKAIDLNEQMTVKYNFATKKQQNKQ